MNFISSRQHCPGMAVELNRPSADGVNCRNVYRSIAISNAELHYQLHKIVTCHWETSYSANKATCYFCNVLLLSSVSWLTSFRNMTINMQQNLDCWAPKIQQSIIISIIIIIITENHQKNLHSRFKNSRYT